MKKLVRVNKAGDVVVAKVPKGASCEQRREHVHAACSQLAEIFAQPRTKSFLRVDLKGRTRGGYFVSSAVAASALFF